MFKAGVGSSVGTDAYREGANAVSQALIQIGETIADVVIVFASTSYEQEKILQGIRSVLPNTLIVGCSTAGEITTQGPSNKPSIAVMAIRSDDVKFYASVGEHIHYDAHKAGVDVAQKMKTDIGDNPDVFIMMPDVLVGNGSDIVRGALSILGDNFPLVGGAPGDDFKFTKTYQYLNDTVHTGTVVALGMKGNIKMGIGIKHGWTPIGIPRKVTKSKGAILYELDGRPAINIYEEYFGDLANEIKTEKLAKLAITYPLGMRIEGHDEMLIRDALTVDNDGSITCTAEIPEGSEIQLMIGSHEEAIKVANEAAKKAIGDLEGSSVKAVLVFSSIARWKLFGDRAGEEIVAIKEAVGSDTPLVGFYTYGEEAPLGGVSKNIKSCYSTFHNETVLICAFSQ